MVEADAANAAILARNWSWKQGWSLMNLGWTIFYGLAGFLGFFTWFGVKGLDNMWTFYMNSMVNYLGTLIHFFTILAFCMASAWWIDQGLISVTEAWIYTGAIIGWTVITFIWIGFAEGPS